MPDAKWFVLAEDSTTLIVDNLVMILEERNPDDLVKLGPLVPSLAMPAMLHTGLGQSAGACRPSSGHAPLYYTVRVGCHGLLLTTISQQAQAMC